MQALVGGNVRFPNLQGIADLFRTKINDTFSRTSGSGTGTGNSGGLIMPNSNPDLMTIMDSAIQETFSDLRNVGDPSLILDNYILTGLPVVNSNLGVGVANPATQVSLAYAGFFDGVQWYPNWTLPISTSKVLAVWERLTGTNEDFVPVTPAPFGLPSVLQNQRFRFWEMRQSALWFPGAIQQVDLRIRARITYPEFLDPLNINFLTTYVPIVDSKNAIAAKMKVLYAERFAPEMYPMAIQEEQRQMEKLKLETVRMLQAFENQRTEFGGEAVQDFAISWAWL